MKIRLEQPVDFDAIDALVRAAFGKQMEADLVRAIRDDACYRPAMSFVAVEGDDIVGHVMVDGCWIRSNDQDRPIVMLSPLAVAPDHQRRGIGTALIEAATSVADAAHEPLIVLEGSPTYYGARGFAYAGDHGLTLPLADWAPPTAAQVRLLTAYDPNDPTLRGDVVYPEPFTGLG
ncbi:N-acetyltransferase [Flexivirga endophytica]|uniref:N-acetyltransferase n=1 Tax=Flexivirga endophytica TaxID=1849103 RepID=A0A916T2W8_9MICO|nr:N-acetyltransferase [Flexivirga endophytica]GGB25741.1 N-acetyltransferase [Flexivirga endophytica]GHB54336.1 N-acetyltransferase [Flexivirga endophytica]